MDVFNIPAATKVSLLSEVESSFHYYCSSSSNACIDIHVLSTIGSLETFIVIKKLNDNSEAERKKEKPAVRTGNQQQQQSRSFSKSVEYQTNDNINHNLHASFPYQPVWKQSRKALRTHMHSSSAHFLL